MKRTIVYGCDNFPWMEGPPHECVFNHVNSPADDDASIMAPIEEVIGKRFLHPTLLMAL